ncbi:hypothetical protein CBS101457_004922 [Exobasidium rhododendri]|nr:hypothetical protein CBS101457_004922 [Exobasidium rhododendri]
MSWPSTVITDAVFIPIYIILLGLSLFNVFRHGHGKASGFVFLAIFCVSRMIGNILLVDAYDNNYKSLEVVKWGYILQGLGYSFFISATAAFYTRARDPDSTITQDIANLRKGIRGMTVAKAIHLVNIIALILLVTGYTDSDGIFPTSGSAASTKTTLNIKAKIGYVIYVVLTVVLAGLVIALARQEPSRETKFIIIACLAALPFMMSRSVYVTYQGFSQHPFQRTLWVKIVFEYIPEVFVIVIYSVLGFKLTKLVQRSDVEMAGKTGQAQQIF